MPTYIETPEKVEAAQVPKDLRDVSMFVPWAEGQGLDVKVAPKENKVEVTKDDEVTQAFPGEWLVINKQGGLFLWSDEAFTAKFTELWD